MGDRLSSRGSRAIARREGRFCWPLGDFEDVDGGEFCIAGSVSVGDLSELGMVNLRSIGDIATESEPSLLEDMLLGGEWLVLDTFSVRLVSGFDASLLVVCDRA